MTKSLLNKCIYSSIITAVISLFFYPLNTNAQARIVVNNNAYINIDGGTAGTPIYVVVANGNGNAITTSGTGGNINSEGEYNKIRWNIGTATGAYSIPFTTQSGVKMPYTMQITTAGAGGTHIDYSTWRTTNMNLPWPSTVTHMLDALTASVDNSLWVIDRFWMSNASNYATKPATTLSFGYDPAETGGANTVTAGNMEAQRFNTSGNVWSGSPSMSYLSWGTDNGTSVSGATIPSGDLTEAWTLVDGNNLLPIELLHFTPTCNGQSVSINWATASESRSDYFEIEKSFDGYNWSSIYSINAQGNSSNESEYSYTDEANISPITYYRLVLHNTDGTQKIFDIKSVNDCGQDENAFQVIDAYNGNYKVKLYAQSDESYTLTLYDFSGKKINQYTNLDVQRGENTFEFNDYNLASGLYILNFQSENNRFTHKLYIQQ